MTAAKIVAAIDLPLALSDFGRCEKALRKEFGKGLVLRQYGSRMLVATPGEGDPLGCGCIACDEARSVWLPGAFRGMIVCPDCGNKRCPKATHHDNECTCSNEPGQEGSVYA